MKLNPTVLAAVAAAALPLSQPVHASTQAINDGQALLRMCKGADKVRALGVMCHSYVNGYLDTAEHYSKGHFCFKASDKELVPPMLVLWLNAHPEQLKVPAPEVLGKVFAANFPCKK